MVKFRWETEFKETDIGKIPKDWDVKKIKDIGEVAGGSTPSTKIKEYWGGDIPWITPKDLANYEYIYISRGERNITEKAVKECSLRIFPKGTILLTSRAPIGYVAIAKNPLTTNQGFRNIIPKDGVVSEYLYYLFKTKTMSEYLKDISGGSTFPELKGSTLKEVEIPYPSPEEQQKIATVLSYFDDLIENKKKQNEILEKIALELFKNWFIDFEPFKNEEFVYNDELDKEIPKGWEVKRLGDILKVESGSNAPQREIYFENAKIPFVRVKHLVKGVCIESSDFINELALKDYKMKLYNEKSIIFQKSGESLKEARVNIVPFKFTAVNHLAVIDSSMLNEKHYFIYCLLRFLLKEIVYSVKGTTLPYLKISDIENKYIIIPPQPILQKFHSLVQPLFEKIINNQKQIMVLKKIRDALLPKLVFGELRVEE